jgi:hypothetical protein
MIPALVPATVHTIAQTTYPQRCQRYIVSVLTQLEPTGLQASDCAAYYAQLVENLLLVRASGGLGMEEHMAVIEFVSVTGLAEVLNLSRLEYCTCFNGLVFYP